MLDDKLAKSVTTSSRQRHLRSQPYSNMDLPPSDDDDVDQEEEETRRTRKERAHKILEISTVVTDKELEKRDMVSDPQQEEEDSVKYTVVIGRRVDGSQDDAANVKDVIVENFSVLIGSKELLKNTSLKISYGMRYGLVGPNGKGKSTLLKLLASRELPVPKNMDLLFVEQEVAAADITALEAVVSANEELVKLRQEVEKSKEGEDVEKRGELYEQLRIIGSDAAEAQASKILAGLGFTKDMQARVTRTFSGGWRMRIALAQALFVQPTLLLLDEPTNHLDLRAVIWLENYLRGWKKTLVVVSHDKDFLNNVCTGIIHFHDLKLHIYRGNFDDFERGFEQRRKETNKKFEIYEKGLKAAKRAGNQKKLQAKVNEKVKLEAKKKSKGKVGEDEEVVEAPMRWRDYTVKFHFPEPSEVTPPLLQVIEASFSYPEREGFSFGLSDVDFGIDMGSRMAIVGPNGAGKSTLLNLLAGDLDPTKGEVRRSHKLRIGRYSQHFVDLLTMDENPVEYLLRVHPDQEKAMSRQEVVRAKLGKFGLQSDSHLTRINNLSGGQKARVVLTSISMSKPHILILDEPTNHLDMQSIDALADALDEFTGGVVVVSHNKTLISRVVDGDENGQLWVVKDGRVEEYDGTFADYKEELQMEIRAETGSGKVTKC